MKTWQNGSADRRRDEGDPEQDDGRAADRQDAVDVRAVPGESREEESRSDERNEERCRRRKLTVRRPEGRLRRRFHERPRYHRRRRLPAPASGRGCPSNESFTLRTHRTHQHPEDSSY
jgi:hypothetical protein